MTDVELRHVKLVSQFPDLSLAYRVLAAVVSLQLDCFAHRLLKRQRLADTLQHSPAISVFKAGNFQVHWDQSVPT